MTREQIEAIAWMLKDGATVDEIHDSLTCAERDAADAMEHDDSEFGDNYRYRAMPGCNADDTTDSRGMPLRPTVNDAGEPYWM